ncbi:MAG: protein translocase subunit SecD [Parcubacteria group bacterium]|jgi:protein-export membrane protein SecD|nr:protein translocase subunit SecD [Parcubacteria group bacterium]
MAKYRFWTIILIALSIVVGVVVYNTEKSGANKFKLGLDLSGGTHLVYKADTSQIAPGDISSAMLSLRDVIERRINLFGVSEPIVQVEKGGTIGGGTEHRLIVELPGVTDVNEAIRRIGETPTLEFKLLSQENKNKIQEGAIASTSNVFMETGLTGRMLQKASIQFDQQMSKPVIGLKFNEEGSELFAKITRENTGDILGIFLDGILIEAPYIREEITGGEAVITGNFTPNEAKQVVRDLNYGALPMPISLLSSETVGATLGEEAINASVRAGIYAFVLIAAFMLIWYRFQGFVAVLALGIYTVINLALFKFIPVTLTAAGIAGFILSVGMAVDANILIFERIKEELKMGKNKSDALREGFSRAWSSIRDSNLSSIITAVILYYFASTPTIKGFALVFLIGVLVSMFSAITASRTILFALSMSDEEKINKK